MGTLNGRWWSKRWLLLAFAPNRRHPDFQAQLRLVAGHEARMREEGLVFAQVLGSGESRLGEEPLAPECADELRRRYHVPEQRFTLLLAAPGGLPRARSTEATPVPDVLAKAREVPLGRQDLEAARKRRR